jgi:hypothetical protein
MNQYNNNRDYYISLINTEIKEAESLLNNYTYLAKHIINKYKLDTAVNYLREIMNRIGEEKKTKANPLILRTLYEYERQFVKLNDSEMARHIIEKYNLELTADHFRKKINLYERDNNFKLRKNTKL